MKNLKLLLEILGHLRRIMRSAARDSLELDMSQYFLDSHMIEYFNSKTTAHNCGTAACVLGYATFDKKLLKLLDFEGISPNNWLAWSIWRTIKETPTIVNIWEIANSIFDKCPESRKASAIDSYLFSKHQLKTLAHLNVEKPTAKDAADYISTIIKNLRAQQTTLLQQTDC